MVRKSDPVGRRGLGALLGAGGLGILVVATAAGCASTSKTAGASGSSSSAPVVVSSPPTTSTSSAGTLPGASPSTGGNPVSSAPANGGTAASPSNHPLIPATGGIVVAPNAQVSTIPAGGRLTAFDSASSSSDGRTLYLGLESQGGACGQYDVVLQQSSTNVQVGLVHLSSAGKMCPMYVTHILVTAKLSAPLAGRTVVDLANGEKVQALAAS